MERPPAPERGGRHRARDEWGPREVIAIVVVLGAFGLAIIGEVTHHPGATIPAWVAALIGGIGIYYYRNGKEK